MANDRLVGGGILAGRLLGIVVYGLLVFYFWQITIQVTAFVAVAASLRSPSDKRIPCVQKFARE